jgi:hypothetical protein
MSGGQTAPGSLIPAAPLDGLVLVLTRGDLEEVLDMRTVIDAVERGLVEQARGTVSMPARQIHTIDGSGSTFVMSAYLGGMEALALKVVSEFRGNRDRGIPSIQGAVLLLDAETGEILSLPWPRGPSPWWMPRWLASLGPGLRHAPRFKAFGSSGTSSS